MTRRDFMTTAAMAAGAVAVGGTSALAADDRGAFYGPTIRDRLWMWGHHSEMSKRSGGITDGGNGTVWDKVDWAIRELKPKYPNFTGGYLDDFFALKAYTQTEDTVPAANLAKAWIKANGERKWGV